MILYNQEKTASIAVDLQEVETDRAHGAGVNVHLKRKHLNATFFNLWIEQAALSGFIRDLKKVAAGRAKTAQLNSPTKDDFYLVLLRRVEAISVGVRVAAHNFTPLKLKDSVALSFEMAPDSLPLMIKELQGLEAKL